MAGIAEEIEHIDLLVPPVALEGFENRFRGQALMNEQRQRRHIERQAFRFASPIQERLCLHRTDALFRFVERISYGVDE